jgi:hypothetical protein
MYVCIYIYICMYVSNYVLCVYLCMYICICMGACTYLCIYVCVYVYMYVLCTYVCKYGNMYVCMYMNRYMYVCTSMHVCMYVFMYVSMEVCMCVCMYVCTYMNRYMYVGMYALTLLMFKSRKQLRNIFDGRDFGLHVAINRPLRTQHITLFLENQLLHTYRTKIQSLSNVVGPCYGLQDLEFPFPKKQFFSTTRPAQPSFQRIHRAVTLKMQRPQLELTTYPQLVSKLRMSGAITLRFFKC